MAALKTVDYSPVSEVMDLLRSVKDQTDETEFDTPLPDRYSLGSTKYVAIFGTVMSGLGGNIGLGGQNVEIRPDTLATELFGGAEKTRQRFRHRFEVDPGYVDALDGAGLVFSGKHPVHPIMQILELPRNIHPFFIAEQFHPELTSRPLKPSRCSSV